MHQEIHHDTSPLDRVARYQAGGFPCGELCVVKNLDGYPIVKLFMLEADLDVVEFGFDNWERTVKIQTPGKYVELHPDCLLTVADFAEDAWALGDKIADLVFRGSDDEEDLSAADHLVTVPVNQN